VAEVLFDDAAAFSNINTLEDLQHHERNAPPHQSHHLSGGLPIPLHCRSRKRSA
jgi:hypothetical protein